MEKLDLFRVATNENLYLYNENNGGTIYEIERTDVDDPRETERDDDVVPLISHPFSANEYSENLFSNRNDVFDHYEQIKFENIPENTLMDAIEEYLDNECRVDYDAEDKYFAVYKDNKLVADGKCVDGLQGDYEQDKDSFISDIYETMAEKYLYMSPVYNTCLSVKELEDAGCLDTDKYVVFAEPVETEYGCYGNYILAGDTDGILSPEKAELREGILKGDIDTFSAWKEDRVYEINKYINGETIQSSVEICFGEKDAEYVIPNNSVELGIYSSIEECIENNHDTLCNDIEIEVSEPVVSSIDSDYLEGSVIVKDLVYDSEEVSCGYDYKIETGEIDLHKYSEPSWIDGSSYETNLPKLINEHIDDILFEVECRCEEYIDKNGLEEKDQGEGVLDDKVIYIETNRKDELGDTEEHSQKKDDPER